MDRKEQTKASLKNCHKQPENSESRKQDYQNRSDDKSALGKNRGKEEFKEVYCHIYIWRKVKKKYENEIISNIK